MALIRRPKLKLVHQGLILVTIPLVFGFAFILILETLMQTYRELRNQTISVARISDRIYSIDSKAVLIQDYLVSPAAFHADVLTVFTGQISQELAQLQQMLSQRRHSPRAFYNLVPVEKDWSAFLAVKDSSNNRHRTEDMQSILRKLEVDLNATAHQELAWQAQHNALAKETDRSMQLILAAVIVLCIVFCPMLVFYFSQNLVRRLRILVENSERFANKQELLPEVGGDDEISKLDQGFRAMVLEVRAAEQAQKEFAAMVNHDIRTPLNALHATLALMAKGKYGELSAEGVERAAQSESLVDRLVELVNQLLDLEKIKSGKLELKFASAQLDNILQKSVDTVYGFAEFKGVVIDVPKTTTCVFADEDRVIQVLINLLGNAIKFSAEAGAIEIGVTEPVEGFVEVSVIDHGSGIGEEHRETVFDRFSQVRDKGDSEKSGDGLGLYICKQIMAAHGGAIGVSPVESGGSRFWLRLRKFDERTMSPSISHGDQKPNAIEPAPVAEDSSPIEAAKP